MLFSMCNCHNHPIKRSRETAKATNHAMHTFPQNYNSLPAEVRQPHPGPQATASSNTFYPSENYTTTRCCPYLPSGGCVLPVRTGGGVPRGAGTEPWGVGPVAGYVMQQTGRRERNFSALFPYRSRSRTARRWLTMTCVHGIRYLVTTNIPYCGYILQEHTYMSVHVHKHAYTHSHIHTRTHIITHFYVRIETDSHKQFQEHTHTHTHTHTPHTHKDTHTHTCTVRFTHTHTHTHTHAVLRRHTCMQVYTHACTHTHIHTHI